MKKAELFFSAVQLPIDYGMLILGGVLAFYLRRTQAVQGLQPLLYEFSIREYLQILLVVAAFFVIIFAIEGLYKIQSNKGKLGELYRVIRAMSVGLMVIVLGLFLQPEWFSSRFIILTGAALGVVFVSLARVSLRSYQTYLLVKKRIGVRRLLLIGENDFAEALKREIKRKPQMGYVLVDHRDEIDFKRIQLLKKQGKIDEIIQSNPRVNKKDMFRLKEFCIRNQIAFKYLPSLIQTSNFNLEIFNGEPLIEIKNTPLEGWGKIIKRAFDIVGALIGIIVFGPLMLLVTIITWIDSGFPAIYFNRRVNHKGGEFDLYKFRYMKKEYSHGKQFSAAHNKKALKFLDDLIKKQSIKQGPLYKIKDDPRKTKFGTFIEKFSIDELPQFFNVLKGEMSLVGPRPHQPMEVEKYQDYQRRVLTIKPGVTGMAQISGRSDLSFNQEVKLDIYYIENWSLWRDIQIIYRTIPSLLSKRKN
jgi:exopolysaccharide biosynthesis polyprenyl glycosylphosphotransferase